MDHRERQRALSCSQSFIVQAPAGSGKTELLTQRFLTLLAQVETPESILALTFTRKAAQEMRHRILEALEDARQDTPCKSEHQLQTRTLAKQALTRNEEKNWQILSKPQQLRITTFDAFCLELYQSLPQLEETYMASIHQHPDLAYQNAILQWFHWCREQPQLEADLKLMLQQLDYKPTKLFQQMFELIKTRDQWLGPLSEQSQESKEHHLDLIRQVMDDYYAEWPLSLPPNLQDCLLELCQKITKIRPDRYPNLVHWNSFSTISKTQVQELASLLFTSQEDFRRAWNHHVGLQAEFCSKAEAKELQTASQALLEALSLHPRFKSLVLHLGKWPDPNQLSLNWPLLQAYYRLLPLLVAHLHLEFARQSSCDFIYIAQHALFALRETDLALHFDQELQHLLVDEFQDTSELQQSLLEQLVLDWEQHPEKTIFVVGDPMQSIYRFRSAKVGIFLQVQRQGLGLIKMQSLELKQNFRSAPELVHHLNQLCQTIFPSQENIDLGAVGFHPAHPALPSKPGAKIFAEFAQNTEIQTQRILEILNQANLDKPSSIAILVRNRHQISPIIKALEKENLSYQGLDLKPIRQNWVIRDLWILTKLILNPGHRSTELACLRSPLLGLSLSEIHHLANLAPKKSLLDLIQTPESRVALSPDTQARIAHFSRLIQSAKKAFHCAPFLDVLYQLSLDLHLEKIYPGSINQSFIETFFRILSPFTHDHAWPNWQMIENQLNQVYVSSHQGHQLQIMTMHKSKGLEFDWVIIPNMGDGPRANQYQALMWLKTKNSTVFFPYDAQESENTHFFRYREQEQESFEAQRLIYVALTRAKHRLYLLDNKIKPDKSSFRSLFAPELFQEINLEHSKTVQTTSDEGRYTYRLPLETYLQAQHSSVNQTKPGLAFHSSYQAKQFGIISHKMLQWICQHHPQDFSQIPWDLALSQLKRAQLSSKLLEPLQASIHGFWSCPVGQWIKAPHESEVNEWALLVKDQHIVRQLILDRSFIDHGKRWIIDFKTGMKEPEVHKKYQQQLYRYALALQELNSKLPIHCGIYYLGQLSWECFEFSEIKSALVAS